MKAIVISIALMFLISCAAPSTITFGPSGKVTSASNYLITTTEGPFTPNIPDNWWTSAIKTVTDGLGTYLVFLKGIQQNTPAPGPAPNPTPGPTPNPNPTPFPPNPNPPPGPNPFTGTIFTLSGNTLTLDLTTLPNAMRKVGFNASDNSLWYAAAFIMAYGPGGSMPDDDAGSLVTLNTQRDAIANWLNGEVAKVAASLRSNASLNLVAITNDAKDRLGFRLGPAIVNRLKEFGSRVKLGDVVPQEQY